MRVFSIFSRSGSKAYPNALRRYRDLFGSILPDVRHEIVVADNIETPGQETGLAPHVRLIGVRPKDREFGSWRAAIRAFADEIKDFDLVALATSAFENRPNGYLRDFCAGALNFVIARDCALGHLDSDGSDATLNGFIASPWLRTSLVILKPQTLLALDALAYSPDRAKIFSNDPVAPFLPDCGLDQELQDVILSWLCGRPSRFKNRWHGCFELTRASMPLFIDKTMAILNERMFSIRLRESGARLVDVSWLKRALENGRDLSSLPEPGEQILENYGLFPGEADASSTCANVAAKCEAAVIFEPQICGEAERGRNRGILFIDKRIPTPDRDAGSLALSNFMRVYAEMGFDVVFAAHEPDFPQEYVRALLDLGIACLEPDAAEDGEINKAIGRHLQENSGKYCAVFMLKAEYANLYYDVVRTCAPDAKVVFNTTDLHYLRLAREARIAGDRELMAQAGRMRDIELDLLDKCDASIVVSEAEMDALREEGHASGVRCLPILIVDPVRDCPGWEKRQDIMFVGGFSHRPNADAAIHFCEEILPLAQAELPCLRFHIIGSNPTPEIKALAKKPGVFVHGFVPDIGAAFNHCRLSVAPIRFGAGIKGKIGQSLAYGVPVISSPVGAEGMSSGEGTGVTLADNSRDFALKLAAAYKDREWWRKESAAALQTAYKMYSPEIARFRQARLLNAIGVEPGLLSWPLRSYDEHERFLRLFSDEIQRRRGVELSLAKAPDENFELDGFCAVCGKKTTFAVNAQSPERDAEGVLTDINWRESLACAQCRLNNRMRAVLHYFYARLRPRRDSLIYLTEQITIMHTMLKRRHPFLIGSEFLGDKVEPGALWNGFQGHPDIRNEDFMRLSFPDSGFDFVLSLDVLEHVPDDLAAFREAVRVLRPGGTFLFTAPFINSRETGIVRAEIGSDGAIVHHLAPEIHGNPLDRENGSLAFRTFAWDMIDNLKSCGFADAWAESIWSREFGYLGGEQYVFVARKEKRP